MIVYNSNIGELDTLTIIELLNQKQKHNIRLKRLQDYYEGNHDILQRVYDDPTKPNNRIVTNYCKDITDFLTSYVAGRPVAFKNAPKPLAEVLTENDEQWECQEVVHDMIVNGFACELFYTDENGEPRYNNINPLECIFILESDLQEDLTGFIRAIKQADGSYIVYVYNNVSMRVFKATESLSELTQIQEETPHYFGAVPVVFYPNGAEMQGNFEQVIPMQDALNKVVSDSVNDWESFVDSYLVLEGLQGTTASDIAEMKANRVLLMNNEDKAYWLTKQADNTRIKVLQDDLRATILELGNVPDLKDISGLGISGEAMRYRLTKSEIQASRLERIITKGIMRKLMLLSNILALTGKAIDYTTIKPIFYRNFIVGYNANEEMALFSGDDEPMEHWGKTSDLTL